jgi:hypothetical protein
MMEVQRFNSQSLVRQLDRDDSDNLERLVHASGWSSERCKVLEGATPIYRLAKFLPLLPRLYSGELSCLTVQSIISLVPLKELRILVLAAIILNERQRQDSCQYMAELITSDGQARILRDLHESRMLLLVKQPKNDMTQQYRANRVLHYLSQGGLINQKAQELLNQIDFIGAENLFPYLHPKSAAWVFQRLARAAKDMSAPVERIYIECSEASAKRLSEHLRAGRSKKEESHLETKITSRLVLAPDGGLLFDVRGYPDLYVETIEE